MFHALFLILSPVFIYAAIMVGLYTGSDAVFLLCQGILLAAIPFLIAFILAKKGKWWWLIAVPVQFLFYLGILYMYNHSIMEYEDFRLFDGTTMLYILVPLIGQSAGIVVRLLHLKRE